jgi:hypothetical protein
MPEAGSSALTRRADSVHSENCCALAEAYCRRHGLIIINVFPLMLGPYGQPKPDIFVAHRLHMDAKGYAIWKEAVAPCLK